MSIEVSKDAKIVEGWTAVDYLRHGRSVPQQVHDETVKNDPTINKERTAGDNSFRPLKNTKHLITEIKRQIP